MLDSGAANLDDAEMGQGDLPQVRQTLKTPSGIGGLWAGFLVLVVVVALIASGWIYFEVAKRQSAQGNLSEPDFMALVGQWQLAITFVLSGCGIVYVLLIRRAWRRQERFFARHLAGINAECKLHEEKIAAEVASREEAQKSLRELEKAAKQAIEKLKTDFSVLSAEKAQLQEALNMRRQSEMKLAEQGGELRRSKEVLELHVRASAEEVQKLQRRSELILNAAGDGICGFDLQGRIIFANPAAGRLMAMKVTDIVGRPGQDLFPAFKPLPTGPDAVSGGDKKTVEAVASRADGSTFAAEYIRSAIVEEGRPVGEVLVFKDISERKQAAEMLAQRMADLARSNAELEQFAFVASHDLQEPLRKIQAFGDRLKAKCDEVGLQQGRDYLERMQGAAARMQTLICDLLTFSRVISRTQPFEAINLKRIAQEVLGDLEVTIEKANAKVEVGDLPVIEADPMQVRQLLQNLIGNALKFQPLGGSPHVRVDGRIVLQPSGRGNTAIITQQSADGGKVSLGEEFCELTIQDNGIGFDEKYLEKIFAVFTRLHSRQEYEGTGIGLAVCRRIAIRHGGNITARSKLGEGATFIVHLPVKASVSEKSAPTE